LSCHHIILLQGQSSPSIFTFVVITAPVPHAAAKKIAAAAVSSAVFVVLVGPVIVESIGSGDICDDQECYCHRPMILVLVRVEFCPFRTYYT
jgi:hypothetical protein